MNSRGLGNNFQILSSRPFMKLAVSYNFCWTTRRWEPKGLLDIKIRISKHEYRNKFKFRMTKIPNHGAARKSFRSLEYSDLGIVSDFGFRISNLITDLPKKNSPLVSSKPVMGKDQFFRGGQGGISGSHALDSKCCL